MCEKKKEKHTLTHTMGVDSCVCMFHGIHKHKEEEEEEILSFIPENRKKQQHKRKKES